MTAFVYARRRSRLTRGPFRDRRRWGTWDAVGSLWVRSSGPISPSSGSSVATSTTRVVCRSRRRRARRPFDGAPRTRGPGSVRRRPDDRLPPARRSRPSLALRVDGLQDLRVVDAGTSRCIPGTSGGRCPRSGGDQRSSRRGDPDRPRGDHSIAFPDAKGCANVLGHGRVSMIHFDAHADTGDIEFGSLWGHGQPMRRLIESGALRAIHFLQVGLRGYWPGPETLQWMAAQRCSFEMTEIVHRGLEVPDRGLRHRDRRVRWGLPLRRHRCLRPRACAGDPRHAQPGGLSRHGSCSTRPRICLELPVCGMDVVEVSPPMTTPISPRRSPAGRVGGAFGDRAAAGDAGRNPLGSLSAPARRTCRRHPRWPPRPP